MEKQEMIQELSQIRGLEWMGNSQEHDEKTIKRLYQKMVDFRKDWIFIDDLGHSVDPWEIDLLKFHNDHNIYDVEHKIINPVTILKNGSFLECIFHDNNYSMHRYLLHNLIYHVFIDTKSSCHEYRILTTGYECYKQSRKPRKIYKISKTPSDECNQLVDLINETKNCITPTYYNKQKVKEIQYMLERIKKFLVKYHIERKI